MREIDDEIVKFDEQHYLKSHFENYKLTEFTSLLFYILFFIRRYLMVYTLVLEPNEVFLIVGVHITSTLFMGIYIVQFWPFKHRH